MIFKNTDSLKIYALIAICALAASSAVLARYAPDAARSAYKRYQERKYPPIKARPRFDAGMKKASDDRRWNEFTHKFREVSALLDRAQAEGYDVRGLRAKLPTAERMARKALFDYAEMMLVSIQARVPKGKKTPGVRPAGTGDGEDYIPAPATRRSTKSRRREGR